MTAVFLAGWLVGATSVALLIGGVIRLADRIEQPDVGDAPVSSKPLYVPSEWSA